MWTQLNKMAQKKKTLCIDADGTIFEYKEYKKNEFGKPIQEVIELLRKKKDEGYNLILSTARNKEEEKALKDHLKDNELDDLFDEVRTGEKPPAMAYVDDKAVNVTEDDWEKKLEKLLKNQEK